MKIVEVKTEDTEFNLESKFEVVEVKPFQQEQLAPIPENGASRYFNRIFYRYHVHYH